VTYRPAPSRRSAWTRAVLVGAVALTACSPDSATSPRLAIEWMAPPAAGVESVADIQLVDASGSPLPRAVLRVEAFMTHPGMAPVEALVEEPASGRYRARLRFTMAGDWIVRVQGATAEGHPIDLQNDVRGVRPAP
jgi:hypothetical protein